MVTVRSGVLVCLAVAVLAGCSTTVEPYAESSTASSEDDAAPPPIPDTVTTICSKFVACGTPDVGGTPYTMSSCMSDYAGWIPPQGCGAAASSSTCAIINGQEDSLYMTTCFPTCPTGSPNTCDGDDIAYCDSLQPDAGAASPSYLYTFSCAAVCAANNQTYTGVCGASYQGEASSNGQEQCWCK